MGATERDMQDKTSVEGSSQLLTWIRSLLKSGLGYHRRTENNKGRAESRMSLFEPFVSPKNEHERLLRCRREDYVLMRAFEKKRKLKRNPVLADHDEDVLYMSCVLMTSYSISIQMIDWLLEHDEPLSEREFMQLPFVEAFCQSPAFTSDRHLELAQTFQHIRKISTDMRSLIMYSRTENLQLLFDT